MADFSRIGILVVDDSRHMRELYRAVLDAFGMPIKAEAEDGQSGIEAVKKYNPDLIITDMNMYPMDGVQFTRALRSRQDIKNRYVPILMITGHNEVKYVQGAVDAGITEFLTKPFTPIALYQRIQHIIEHPRPFVRGEAFFGPDRRRSRQGGKNKGRRGTDSGAGGEEVFL
ncbi:hypothetical protein AYO42_01445 [Rhizomicrobium sp. SCGC AG-212-E05]|nr:hypothetical protein AYO42_01445 [Rhizomicrobium sp. SCGC AG-212-E05]